ncbi:uncharacterized protein LOC144638601 [Oculina patagonica]
MANLPEDRVESVNTAIYILWDEMFRAIYDQRRGAVLLNSSGVVQQNQYREHCIAMENCNEHANAQLKMEGQDTVSSEQVSQQEGTTQIQTGKQDTVSPDQASQQKNSFDSLVSALGYAGRFLKGPANSALGYAGSVLKGPLTSALGYSGTFLKDHTKPFLEKHSKKSVGAAVALVAGLLMTLYPQSGGSKPLADTLNLSAFPKTLLQGEKDLTNYDFGIRMDVQVQDCSSDTHWKKTFPDLDYSLLGYDILYGYPLANGRDPGFRHPIFSTDYSKPKQTSDCRYVVPQGFTVVPSESCMVSFESKLVRNKQEMSEHLGVQAKIEGGGWGFEFSASASYNKDTSEMSTGEFLYVMSHAECQNYYSMVDFQNPPPFDPGFLAAANKLADPKASPEDVLEFIKYYGTHFFTDVTFGAKFVQKHKVSQTAYQSLKKSKISVEVQASYSGLFSIGGGFSLDKEQSEAASNFAKNVTTTTFTLGSTPPANGDAMTWAASVQQNPVPMLYSLSQIDNLFTGQFTNHLTPGVNYNLVREKLSDVSQQYCRVLKEKGTVHSCESKFHLEAAGIDITGKGYLHLREVDKPLCISTCLHDADCTAVTYSVHKPPLAGSLCKFYRSINESVYVHLNLTKQDGSNGILSNLILFISKLQDVYLIRAKLSGAHYSESKINYEACNSACTNDLFCDAFSYSGTAGTCSMYSTKNITNIVFENDSYVTFIGLHSN